MLRELNEVLQTQIQALDEEDAKSKARIRALEQQNRELEARFHSTGPSRSGKAGPHNPGSPSQDPILTRHFSEALQAPPVALVKPPQIPEWSASLPFNAPLFQIPA